VLGARAAAALDQRLDDLGRDRADGRVVGGRAIRSEQGTSGRRKRRGPVRPDYRTRRVPGQSHCPQRHCGPQARGEQTQMAPQAHWKLRSSDMALSSGSGRRGRPPVWRLRSALPTQQTDEGAGPYSARPGIARCPFPDCPDGRKCQSPNGTAGGAKLASTPRWTGVSFPAGARLDGHTGWRRPWHPRDGRIFAWCSRF